MLPKRTAWHPLKRVTPLLNRHTGDAPFDRPRNYRPAPTRLRAYFVINAGFSCGMTNPTAAPILRLAHLDPDQHRAAAYMVLLKTMATTQSHGRLSISGLGWSLSATLVVLFVLCMLAALFVPLAWPTAGLVSCQMRQSIPHASGSTGSSGASCSDG